MEKVSKGIVTENVQQPTQMAGGQLGSGASVVETIVSETVNMKSDAERERQERLELLRGLRITSKTEVEQEQYALSVDGVGFFALDDVHGLKSKQKAGKTTVNKVCAAALMAGQQFRVKSELEEATVLWVDTEQKPADVKAIIDDVCLLSGRDADYVDEHLRLFQLRKMNYETLIEDFRLLMDDNHPQVALVDGIVEFVASFNDEQTSRKLVKDLMMLAEEYHCAVVCVLHENKAADDQNMRGHLGTVLAQKAGTVLQCLKSQTGVITVTCPDSRHGQMPEWSIVYDGEGHLHDADEQRRQEVELSRMSKKQRQQAESARLEKERADAALAIVRDNGGAVSRSLLTTKLIEQTGRSRSTVATFITKQLGQTLVETSRGIEAHPDHVLGF